MLRSCPRKRASSSWHWVPAFAGTSGSLLRPDPLQQLHRRVSVRHHAVASLLAPDLVAQIEIDAAFKIVHRMAERLEPLLQCDALIARELRIAGRPCGA